MEVLMSQRVLDVCFHPNSDGVSISFASIRQFVLLAPESGTVVCTVALGILEQKVRQ